LSGHLSDCFDIAPFDIRNDARQDIRLPFPADAYRGIVHLAAVSRVVTGEQDPENCIATNEASLRALYRNLLAQRQRPWVIFVSSREVYGSSGPEPIDEDTEAAPRNIYARTKVAGERLSVEAREAGLQVNIVRLSSVYGSVHDHPDRLAPAFARTAAKGGTLRMEGSSHRYDLTHVDDVARGLGALVRETDRGRSLPPIHLVSGTGTSVGLLAALSIKLSRAPVDLIEAAPRPYGVTEFIGNPARARDLLGWTTQISVEQGMQRLIADFAAT
jgi:nucleoside-diphosphate-sugar epimerase